MTRVAKLCSTFLLETAGAAEDYNNRAPSWRAHYLETALRYCRDCLCIGFAAAILYLLYFAYQHPITIESSSPPAPFTPDQKRMAMFRILITALSAPVVIFLAYIVTGFVYNGFYSIVAARLPRIFTLLTLPTFLWGVFFLMWHFREEISYQLWMAYHSMLNNIEMAKSVVS